MYTKSNLHCTNIFIWPLKINVMLAPDTSVYTSELHEHYSSLRTWDFEEIAIVVRFFKELQTWWYH